MTITSALIAQMRREFQDEPKSTSVSRAGNGSVNLFNLARYPIIESSYSIYKGTSALVENNQFTLDLDTGDLQLTTTPANGVVIKSNHRYAHWRDKQWVEATNNAISELNARGFFRQVVRNGSILRISANVQVYSGPSACVDLYELLVSNNYTSGGVYSKINSNWSYQQDGNKLVLGNKPSSANYAQISYLRNLQTYTATSATLDILPTWETMVKKHVGHQFFRSLAAKIAKQGNASIDEGHFSFTNLRTQSNDLLSEFNDLAKRAKPTRPAKDFQWNDPSLG